MSCKDLISFRIGIRIVTPVHIGDGDAYTKLDYVYDRINRKVGFLNPREWLAFLSRNNLLRGYEQQNSTAPYDQKSGIIFDNHKWLDSVGRRNVIQSNPELFMSVMEIPADIRNLNDIHRHIKDVYGRPYIPGSSIKGMLRNSICADLIQKAKGNPTLNDELTRIWQSLEYAVDNDRNCKGRDFAAQEIRSVEEKIFKTVMNREGKAFKKEIQDPFRGIIVGDSEPLSAESTILVQKQDLVVPRRSEQLSSIPLQRESIRPGMETSFSVTLDRAHLQLSGLGHLKTADDLLAAVKAYRSSVLLLHESKLTKQIEQNQERYRDYRYKVAKSPGEDGATCVLGGGVGFQSHSLLYALAPDEEKGRQLIIKLLSKQFPKVHNPEKDLYAAPRTIKTTMLNPDSTYPKYIQQQGAGRYKLGICALREVK